MRRALLLWATLAPAVHAQVIECPSFYPSTDTALAEVPHQHKGRGFVAKSPLRNALMYAGEINGHQALVGEPHKVKGGRDLHHGFEPGESKWLVCFYSEDREIAWWEQLDPKVTNCVVQIREGGQGPMSVKATCR
jgi:hypothetical protein